MKSLIIILLFAAGLQAQDTIMLSNVVAKKTTLRVITKDTSGVETEVKEVLTYAKAVDRLKRLEQDTTMLNQHLSQMDRIENQITSERRKARNQKRQAIGLIDRLKALLPSLQ
jgi:septal ring factor EnvC (AmiA/AmiB activator)